MNLSHMIPRRKSVRSYTNVPVDDVTLERIRSFIAQTKPLDPAIRVRAEIISRSEARSIVPWLTPQLIAIFCEEAEGALENVGFLFQQVDLYLQSIGLGSCWLGMGKLHAPELQARYEKDGLRFVIMLSFGYPKGEALRQDASDFRRKSLEQIADRADEQLEPARLAPSAVNSQPWFFTHEGSVIHAWRMQPKLLKNLTEMNRIDMGIALAHLYAANPDSFRFFRADAPPVSGGAYTGSFTLQKERV